VLGIFIQGIPSFDGLFHRGVPDAFSEAHTPSGGITLRRRFMGGFVDKDFFCRAPLRSSPAGFHYPRWSIKLLLGGTPCYLYRGNRLADSPASLGAPFVPKPAAFPLPPVEHKTFVGGHAVLLVSRQQAHRLACVLGRPLRYRTALRQEWISKLVHSFLRLFFHYPPVKKHCPPRFVLT
jgi:hypothetical protein